MQAKQKLLAEEVRSNKRKEEKIQAAQLEAVDMKYCRAAFVKLHVYFPKMGNFFLEYILLDIMLLSIYDFSYSR